VRILERLRPWQIVTGRGHAIANGKLSDCSSLGQEAKVTSVSTIEAQGRLPEASATLGRRDDRSARAHASDALRILPQPTPANNSGAPAGDDCQRLFKKRTPNRACQGAPATIYHLHSKIGRKPRRPLERVSSSLTSDLPRVAQQAAALSPGLSEQTCAAARIIGDPGLPLHYPVIARPDPLQKVRYRGYMEPVLFAWRMRRKLPNLALSKRVTSTTVGHPSVPQSQSPGRQPYAHQV
jgi:hypothetical protein